MADKAWKAFERRVALILGGTRRPVMGHEKGGTDIDHEYLAIQCKQRGGKYPAYLGEWMAGLGAGGKTPLIVWGLKHQDTDKAMVVMRLRDFAELIRREATDGKEQDPLL